MMNNPSEPQIGHALNKSTVRGDVFLSHNLRKILDGYYDIFREPVSYKCGPSFKSLYYYDFFIF
ncbi:hypothetical protein NARC_40084 [Candidatus Nitrosocosmicus arcticus]|uniref:Uncharacterized protein n=1 Tax=Candidatus Nitrosocosmicus arcticus TaxID=2035267 RepID=A0A557SWZ3_9ARCH|nr:hypothetical protein NARC_40084 [Candidatus Nitrosocosmicus arcticus]